MGIVCLEKQKAEPNETCRGEDSESQSQFLVEVVLHAAGEPNDREASAETHGQKQRFFWDVMDVSV